MNTSENTGEDVPFDLSKAAAAATEELLPSKSKERYEKQFQIFEDWRRLKNVTSLTEDVFLAYFAEKSNSYKASSLWSTYSMLKAVLLLKENLDISKFCKVTAYLKRKSAGYQPKKSKCLSRDQIDKFLLEAPDKEFLLMKVALIFGVSGACRCDELSRIMCIIVGDGGRAAFAKEKPGNGSGDGYSRKTSITEPLEESMALNRDHFREQGLFSQRVESSEC
ncbi:hypothetical protein Zmor_021381 [Zophobas morio]|uniref:Uncharacterized protein n=1 Tax=Zophobas morio TaxID=2755281 RepID=A0AA38I562_9CUCU|nr:hypothetical protein Zmor_021381 [Zophobas morio]